MQLTCPATKGYDYTTPIHTLSEAFDPDSPVIANNYCRDTMQLTSAWFEDTGHARKKLGLPPAVVEEGDLDEVVCSLLHSQLVAPSACSPPLLSQE